MDSYILTIRQEPRVNKKLLRKSENRIILFLLVFHYVTSHETNCIPMLQKITGIDFYNMKRYFIN